MDECCVGCKASLICLSAPSSKIGHYVRPTFCLVVYGREETHIFAPYRCPKAWARYLGTKAKRAELHDKYF